MTNYKEEAKRRFSDIDGYGIILAKRQAFTEGCEFAAPKWMPVTDGLPDGKYIVCFKGAEKEFEAELVNGQWESCVHDWDDAPPDYYLQINIPEIPKEKP